MNNSRRINITVFGPLATCWKKPRSEACWSLAGMKNQAPTCFAAMATAAAALPRCGPMPRQTGPPPATSGRTRPNPRSSPALTATGHASGDTEAGPGTLPNPGRANCRQRFRPVRRITRTATHPPTNRIAATSPATPCANRSMRRRKGRWAAISNSSPLPHSQPLNWQGPPNWQSPRPLPIRNLRQRAAVAAAASRHRHRLKWSHQPRHPRGRRCRKRLPAPPAHCPWVPPKRSRTSPKKPPHGHAERASPLQTTAHSEPGQRRGVPQLSRVKASQPMSLASRTPANCQRAVAGKKLR